jgi:hypothetical protein
VIQDSNPVEFTFDNTGKLGIELPFLQGNVESGLQKKYTTYHCRVQGSGVGTNMVRWDFREDPDNSTRTQAVQTTLFGIIPSVTWNFKF